MSLNAAIVSALLIFKPFFSMDKGLNGSLEMEYFYQVLWILNDSQKYISLWNGQAGHRTVTSKFYHLKS